MVVCVRNGDEGGFHMGQNGGEGGMGQNYGGRGEGGRSGTERGGSGEGEGMQSMRHHGGARGGGGREGVQGRGDVEGRDNTKRTRVTMKGEGRGDGIEAEEGGCGAEELMGRGGERETKGGVAVGGGRKEEGEGRGGRCGSRGRVWGEKRVMWPR